MTHNPSYAGSSRTSMTAVPIARPQAWLTTSCVPTTDVGSVCFTIIIENNNNNKPNYVFSMRLGVQHPGLRRL